MAVRDLQEAGDIPILDLMFFLTETKDNPKHVGALLHFDLPAGASPRFVSRLVADYRKARPVAPFDRIPEFSLTHMPRWVHAGSPDMKYHVQHAMLPPGATKSDLHGLVSELHAQLLDRRRPCFRVYFIEGLPDRTFAIYLKIHHAMVDGHSAVARLVASLSEVARAGVVTPIFAVNLQKTSRAPGARRRSALESMVRSVLSQATAARDLSLNLLRKSLRVAGNAAGAGSAPFTAMHGPMNAPSRAVRSVATLSLPFAEMKAVGKAFGATINDVAMALLDAGLTSYLEERGARPRRRLVAMCPVSLRELGDTEATTKASAIFVPLGSPRAGIAARLRQVIAASRSAKDDLRSMSKDAAMLYAILAFGLGEAAHLLGGEAFRQPLANFVLSNVPASRSVLYLRGARLRSIHPISTLGAGIGLNVTLLSYADTLDFGLVANGASMPELEPLASHVSDAFVALKRAAAMRSGK